MTISDSDHSRPSLLLVGASRGLGLAITAEFAKRNWIVVATVRDRGQASALHDLARKYAGRIEIETVDITQPEQVGALRARLVSRSFDMLFVNAGTANRNQDETIADVSTEEFVRVMVTNALSPMRAVENLQDVVKPAGLIGIMSSGQGSVTNNEKGGHEVYRGTKAALNQYMRSYAARNAGGARALVLIAPGWIKTELGGAAAPLAVEEAVPQVVDTLLEKQGKPGLEYLDRMGKTVPW